MGIARQAAYVCRLPLVTPRCCAEPTWLKDWKGGSGKVGLGRKELDYTGRSPAWKWGELFLTCCTFFCTLWEDMRNSKNRVSNFSTVKELCKPEDKVTHSAHMVSMEECMHSIQTQHPWPCEYLNSDCIWLDAVTVWLRIFHPGHSIWTTFTKSPSIILEFSFEPCNKCW